MKKIPKPTYKSEKELRDEIQKRQTAISLLDDGAIKQRLTSELVQLRAYADMKALLGEGSRPKRP